jgi:uncharacterized protein (TIGR00369 family)
MKTLEQILPVTATTVEDAHAFMFAPWVRQLGLCDFEVREGYVRARLPERDDLKFVAGAICGQVIMSAIDTVAALAMCTTERATKGTAYQHTHFLRPARGDDLVVEVTVTRFGKASAYAEARVMFASGGELVAHAVTEYAF